MRSLYAVLTLGLAATPAFADVLVVPEPGSLALVGLAVAVGLAVTRRNKK